jgi:hypothetical protein
LAFGVAAGARDDMEGERERVGLKAIVCVPSNDWHEHDFINRSQGTSLHIHKSLISVYEGDFGVNISLI